MQTMDSNSSELKQEKHLLEGGEGTDRIKRRLKESPKISRNQGKFSVWNNRWLVLPLDTES